MNDIKAALSKALHEWEEKPVAVHPVVGVSKATFDFIRNHPGLTKKMVVNGLTQQGYKSSSTSSLISAMLKQKQIREDEDGLLVAIATKYRPLKSTYTPVSKGITALPIKYTAPPERKQLDVDVLIDTLTIREAIVLHAKLSEALGR